MMGEVLDSRPGYFGMLMAKPAFWVVVVLLLVIAPLTSALRRPRAEPPRKYMALPAFELTNHRGEPFGSEQLKGKVWVANFIFTSCPSVCPALMERMQQVQHRSRNAGAAVRLVTITVDPENDTPEKLAAYAKRFKASQYRWDFLTGELDAIDAAVVKGFKLAMGKDEANDFQLFHSERFVLVDAEGTIRGYYEATDEGIDKLMRDITLVLNVG
jgi:protein SCO1/2